MEPGIYNRIFNKKTGKEYMIPVRSRSPIHNGNSKYVALRKKLT